MRVCGGVHVFDAGMCMRVCLCVCMCMCVCICVYVCGERLVHEEDVSKFFEFLKILLYLLCYICST